jgi:hypothetical protein
MISGHLHHFQQRLPASVSSHPLPLHHRSLLRHFAFANSKAKLEKNKNWRSPRKIKNKKNMSAVVAEMKRNNQGDKLEEVWD